MNTPYVKIRRAIKSALLLLALAVFAVLIYQFGISAGEQSCKFVESNEIDSPENSVDLSENNDYSPQLVLKNDNYKVYRFSQGLNHLDLNNDGYNDNVFVSHIVGADYYDYHINANTDIYNFYINHPSFSGFDGHWKLVTKESPGKQIDKFERDFSTLEEMGCNGGSALRIVQTKNNETLLALIDENSGEEDGCNTRVIFSIFILKKSGNLVGSDYIFSHVKDVVGQTRGQCISYLGDKDIEYAIEQTGY